MNAKQSRASLKKMLTEHPFLDDIKPEYLDFIASCASTINFEPDEHIFIEGGEANNFYLLHEGEVALKTFLSAREGFVTIQHINNGEILGWSWLVPPHDWHFSAFATKPTTAIVVNGPQLRAKCEMDPEFGYEIQKRILLIIGQRLRMTRRRLG